MDDMTAYAVVVLAGGAAGRLGGADKPGLSIGGTTLLDRVLAASSGASSTVVVGPRRPTARPVEWTREDPPGGGPLPALAAALDLVDEDVVVLLAADLPFLDPMTVPALVRELVRDATATARRADDPGGTDRAHHGGDRCTDHDGDSHGSHGRDGRDGGDDEDRKDHGHGGHDGVVVVDASGRDQPLLAAYRTESLRRELALLATEHGTLTGLPLRMLTAALDLRRTADVLGSAFDCDTWDDVLAARARLAGHPRGTDDHGNRRA